MKKVTEIKSLILAYISYLASESIHKTAAPTITKNQGTAPNKVGKAPSPKSAAPPDPQKITAAIANTAIVIMVVCVENGCSLVTPTTLPLSSL